MNPERHARAKEIFLAACELAGDERRAHLARACGADAELRAAVEELLESDARPCALLAAADEGGAARWLASGLAEDEAAGAELPARIGPYRIVRLLGRGGMGVVYEAEQEDPARRVALKVLSVGLGSREHQRRFRLEAQLLARLHHPGIAHVYAAGTAELGGTRQPYFALELVEGATLLEHASRAALGPEQRLELFVQVCEAVQHAHENGILHRDLKPTNVVVDAAGRAKVLDFGVALLLEKDGLLEKNGARAPTRTGLVVGTLASMSPEQVAGPSAELDARSDVYALGVIAYELLTARLPLELAGLALPEAARRICEEDPPLAGRLDRRLAGDPETILAKALSKDRAQRYDSARALADDVRRFLRREPIAARRASTFYHLRMFARRNRALVGGVLVAALALVAGTLVSAWFAWSESELRVLAEASRARAEREAYRGNVVAAGLALEQGNARHARALLDGVERLGHGFEWRRLRRASEPWIASFDAPVRHIWQAAFLGAGPEAVAVGHEGGVLVWNTESGARLVERADEPRHARPLALSADGATVLSASPQELVLWDARTGVEHARLAAPPRLVLDARGTAALAPDGRRFAVSTHDRGLVLFDAAVGETGTWLGEGGLPAFGDGGRLLVSASADSVALWSGTDGRALGRLASELPARALAVDAAGARIAVVDAERRVRVLARAGGAELRLPEALLEGPVTLAFAPDGRRLAAMLDDGALWIWDVDAARLLERFGVGRSSWKPSLAWSADGERLLTAAHAHPRVLLWSLDEGRSAEALRGHTSYVYPVAYTPDGARILSGGWDDTLRIWCAARGELLATLASGAGRVQTLAVSPDGRRIVAGTGGGALVAWDARTGAELARVHASPWSSVAFAPDGASLAAASELELGRVHLLDPVTLAPRALLEDPQAAREPLRALAFAPSGAYLVTGSRKLVLWDLATRTIAAERAGLPVVRALAFAPGGERLAVAGDGGLLALCDARTLARQRDLAGHPREVFAAAFAPDGSRLFSGGRDGLLRVWDPLHGDLLAEFRAHRDYIWSLAASPDGARVATGSGDGEVRQWQSEPASVSARRRAQAAARARALDPRVARLLLELGTPAAVAERLEEDPALEGELRPAAFDELLRQASAGR